MDILRQFGLSIAFYTQALRSQSQNWQLPIHYKLGHAYIITLPTFVTCYKKSKLLRMQKRFTHPSQGKLFDIIKPVRSEKADRKLTKLLQYIAAAFEICAKYFITPFRCYITTPSPRRN